MKYQSAVSALLIGSSPVVIGCSSGEAAPAAAVVRDSAGITIVENPGPIWRAGEGWRLSEEPVLEIGEDEGEDAYQLFRVSNVVRLHDGRVALGNAGTDEVRFYRPDGTYIRSVGREGGGPGEFRSLSGPYPYHDSLAVYDRGNQRMAILGPDGGWVRSFSTTAPGGASSAALVAPFEDGTVAGPLIVMFTAGASASRVSRDSSVHVRFTMDGELLDTLGVFQGSEWFVRQTGTGMGVMSLAMGKRIHTAVHGTAIYVGETDSYEVRRYESDGRLVRIIHRDLPVRPVTPQDIARYKEEQLEQAEAQWRSFQEEMLNAMPFPSTMPAHGSIAVDAEGNLWVAAFRASNREPHLWTVFDPDGRMLGDVTLPDRFRVTDMGPDYVLGVWRDEFDVERVRMFRLVKP